MRKKTKQIMITCCGATFIKRGGKRRKIPTNNKNDWVTLSPCEHDSNIQVIPLDDTIHHQTKGTNCLCEPKIEFEKEGRIVIHSAKDGRE